MRDGEVFEEHVALDGEGRLARTTVRPMRWSAAPCGIWSATSVAEFADGYRSELLPQLPYWIQAVAGSLACRA